MSGPDEPITLTEDERRRLLRWAECCEAESFLQDDEDYVLLAKLGGRAAELGRVYDEQRRRYVIED